MAIRLSKCLLLASIALFYTFIVFNNIADYGTNFLFVRHVLSMDTLFPGSHSLWRAIQSSSIHTALYLLIILWEIVTAALCWWATARMLRALRASTASFTYATHLGTTALTLGMLLWFTAFIVVGGEWFLMWQSHLWNGQETAFHNFAILGVILLYLNIPEPTSAGPQS